MTRRETLIALRDAVREGPVEGPGFMPVCAALGFTWKFAYTWEDAQESTDAALRLLREVLPGWAVEGWTIWPGLPSRVQIVGTHEGEDGTRWHNFKDGRVQAESETPARALLLAILEALIAKEVDDDKQG